MKNVVIRCVVAALSLTNRGLCRWLKPPPTARRTNWLRPVSPTSYHKRPGEPHLRESSQYTMAMGAGSMSPPASTHKGAIQSGNEFNWLGAG
jgi:hypothetical protein